MHNGTGGGAGGADPGRLRRGVWFALTGAARRCPRMRMSVDRALIADYLYSELEASREHVRRLARRRASKKVPNSRSGDATQFKYAIIHLGGGRARRVVGQRVLAGNM